MTERSLAEGLGSVCVVPSFIPLSIAVRLARSVPSDIESFSPTAEHRPFVSVMSEGDDLDSDVRGTFLLWCKPSTGGITHSADGVPVRDTRRIARLCKSLVLHMVKSETDFRESYRHSPMLVCFQSDATSYLTMWRKILNGKEGQGLQRHSHDLCEFLIQRLFLATCRGSKIHKSLAIVHPPRLMRHGKTASVHVQAWSEQVQHPFSGQARHSIVVSFYCWDRAVFSACFRLVQQRHRLFWDTDAASLYGEFRHLAKHRDIVLGTGCVLHDINSALRWATQSFLDKAEMKNLYNLVEGLRNGARYLYKVLDIFIVAHVQFDDGGEVSVEDTETFWSILGVSGHMLHEFGVLRPRWDGQTMWINGAEQQRGDIFDRIAAVIAYPWRWRKYNSARFGVLGGGSRMLLQARLLGLDRIVAIGRAAPLASDYWLHHYANLDDRMSRFFIVCGLGACVADTLLVAVMEDARVPRRCEELTGIMVEQIDFLAGLPSAFWQRLALSVHADEPWCEIRHDSLQAASVTAAWVDRKVLALARDLPWRLCAGDLRSNVRSLSMMPPENLDPATASLHFMLRSGIATEDELVSTLFLMAEAPWSVMDSEQSHGSLAIQHRYHRDLSAEMLSLRGYLHMCRAFFNPDPEELGVARLQRRLDRLHDKNPNMIRGSGVFAGQLISIVRSRFGQDLALDLPFWQRQMCKAMGKWTGLVFAEQRRFHLLADVCRDEQRRAIDDEKEQLAAAIVMLRQRHRELSVNGPKHIIGANRFSIQEMASLASIALVLPESHQAADKFLSEVSRPAEPLEATLEAQLACLPHHRFDRARDGPAPSWLKIVCRNRDVFQGTAFIRLDSGSREVVEALLFLVACQSPFEVMFQRLLHRDPLAELAEGRELDLPQAVASFERVFCPDHGAWISDIDVSIDPVVQEWFILPQVSHINGGWLATDEALVPWSVFVRDLSSEEEPQPKQPKAAPAKARKEELPAWARQWLGQTPTKHPKPSDEKSQGPPQLPMQDVPLSKEQEDEVEVELAEMRAWLCSVLPAESQDFSVRVLGGRWTRRNRNLTWDAIQGYARTADAKLFCASFGMQQSMRFAAQEHGRNDGLLLAQAWVERMAYYYSFWEAADFAPILFSPIDATGHDDLELVSAMLDAGPESSMWARGREIRELIPGEYRDLE